MGKIRPELICPTQSHRNLGSHRSQNNIAISKPFERLRCPLMCCILRWRENPVVLLKSNLQQDSEAEMNMCAAVFD
jgi:hypothetical protein